MSLESQLCDRGLFLVCALVFLGFSCVYVSEFCKGKLSTTYSRVGTGKVKGFARPALAVCVPYDGVYFDARKRAEAGVRTVLFSFIFRL